MFDDLISKSVVLYKFRKLLL